ncbi:porin family protein [Dyadobacter sp. 32]|uniref:porin family protein n=1 Tax=Dyadobacter sp. 32 TaxID=538966 RepID=UPI0011F068BB
MKKALLLMCMVVSATVSSAQTISLGPKVGLNVSNYTGGDIESNALVGFHLGGILNLGIGKVFSLQPEVLFSTQGAKIDNGSQKRDFKTTYVAVPVMAKFRSAGGFYFEVGPQVSFRTGEDIPDQTIDHFSKNLDLAVGAGLGYQAGFGLGIGARYLAGISKVGNFDKTAAANPDFKNSVIQVSLFFAIPVAGR